MTARHVRGGACHHVLLGIDAVYRGRNAVVGGAEQQVLLADRVEPGRTASVLGDAGLVVNGDVFEWCSEVRPSFSVKGCGLG